MTTLTIDFGTSNTVISFLEPDTQTPKTVRLPELSRLFRLAEAEAEVPVVPTLVFVKEPNQLILGEQVRSQRLGLARPERLFKNFKRELAADVQPPSRLIDGRSYGAEFVAEQFLQAIWHHLHQQSIQPSQVIFTVPVGAFERYLGWFRDFAAQLNLPAKLVDESTAAALGYAVQRPGSLVLVVDFGGGTLDLSLVRTALPTLSTVTSTTISPTFKAKTSNATSTTTSALTIPDNSPPPSTLSLMPGNILRAEVLAKSDAYVGGEDIDLWIAEDYLRQIGSSRQAVGSVGWQNLLEIAERLKIRLSGAEAAKESWLDETSFMSHELHLSRAQLEEILETHQLLEHLRQALDEVLAIAMGKGIAKSAIEQVLLVGGSCLIPAVQQLMVSYFGRQRVKLDKPFEAVAHGALMLSQLSGLDDYLHHTYAIRLWDPYAHTYTYFPLFPQGTQYPCQRPEPLILQVANPGQTEIRLDIGELAETAQAEVTFDAQGRMTSAPVSKQQTYRSLDSQHHSICVAHLDPPGYIGIDRVAVQFEVTEQRMLIATVKDLLTHRVLVERKAIAKLR